MTTTSPAPFSPDLRAANRWESFKFWLYCRWRWAGAHGLLGNVRMVSVAPERPTFDWICDALIRTTRTDPKGLIL
jgi:hypothetical protein